VPPVLVVGAGAAGLVAAIAAAEAGTGPVVLVEGTSDGGRKVLISGGGRCNVLPAAIEPHRFTTDSSPALLRRMLRAWPLEGQREFFEREVGVPLTLDDATRKYFPVSNRAIDVRDGLVALARRRGVAFRWSTRLTSLAPHDGAWRAGTSRGDLDAGAVVLATGGLSVPATGSDGVGLALAARLGHVIRDTYPALTPLTADSPVHAGLSGISLPVRIRAKWEGQVAEATGGLLFTHRGYSGPAVLDVSHVAVRSLARGPGGDRAVIRVAWTTLTADEWRRVLANASGLTATAIARHLPQRLAERLMDDTGVPVERRAAELRRGERAALVEALTAYVLPWTSDEGYRKAEVTGGGVALEDVDPRTLESRRCPGLFLCGELLDAFGPIGGHNFAWAWATGRAAGRGAALRSGGRE
jgi:hypothetical protein